MFTKDDVGLALDSIQAEVETMREAMEGSKPVSQADVEAGLRFIRRQCKAIKDATRLQNRVDADMTEEEEAVAA